MQLHSNDVLAEPARSWLGGGTGVQLAPGGDEVGVTVTLAPAPPALWSATVTTEGWPTFTVAGTASTAVTETSEGTCTVTGTDEGTTGRGSPELASWESTEAVSWSAPAALGSHVHEKTSSLAAPPAMVRG